MVGHHALTPHAALAALWSSVGGRQAALPHVQLTGADPVLPSSFAIGVAAQTTIAASGLAAAEIWRQRSGRDQFVGVDMRHAAIEFRSERYLRTETPLPDPWDKIAGLYRTRDAGWVRIHTNFAHHRDGLLQLLDVANDRAAVQRALDGWDGEAFETAAAASGLVATVLRSPDQWLAHPQGQAVAALPVLEVVKIGDAPARPFPPGGTRPLSGIRVLDLTRIIAGPVAGRTLAAHGAEVLQISSPHLPSIPSLVIDTGRGKRPAFLDLNATADHARLIALARTADVFIEGYRPGGLAARGFGPEDLAARNPGLVYVSLSAYSHRGPWANRRGFDSLTQNANGINFAEAEAFAASAAPTAVPTGLIDRPKELPCQALDHGAGYLLALGTQIALARRADEGGSWLVRTSLAQVGHWLMGLGRVTNGFAPSDPTFDDVADVIESSASGFGRIRAVRHAAILSETPAHFLCPAMPLGHYPAAWDPS